MTCFSGEDVTFICNKLYKLSTSYNVVTCTESGTFNKEFPTCKLKGNTKDLLQSDLYYLRNSIILVFEDQNLVSPSYADNIGQTVFQRTLVEQTSFLTMHRITLLRYFFVCCAILKVPLLRYFFGCCAILKVPFRGISLGVAQY